MSDQLTSIYQDWVLNHSGKTQTKTKLWSGALIDAANWIYTEHLSHPFDINLKPLYSADWELKIGTTVIPRPNHGLAHSIRCAFILPVVCDFYKNAIHNKTDELSQSLLSILNDPTEIEKLQIALLFSSVGRGNDMGYSDNPEIYQTFRQQSARRFEEYVNQNATDLFQSPEEIRQFAFFVQDFGNPTNHNPRCILMRQCHRLDLPRCYSKKEFTDKCLLGAAWDTHSLYADLGKENADRLLEYAINLLKATGDRILFGNMYQSYEPDLFKQCSINVTKCLKALTSVIKPHPYGISTTNSKKLG